jgi:hypothetical protein
MFIFHHWFFFKTGAYVGVCGWNFINNFRSMYKNREERLPSSYLSTFLHENLSSHQKISINIFVVIFTDICRLNCALHEYNYHNSGHYSSSCLLLRIQCFGDWMLSPVQGQGLYFTLNRCENFHLTTEQESTHRSIRF